MQRTKMRLQRVVAMLLVALSLFGMIPLDIIEPLDLTSEAHALSEGESFRYTGWKTNFQHNDKRFYFPADRQYAFPGGDSGMLHIMNCTIDDGRTKTTEQHAFCADHTKALNNNGRTYTVKKKLPDDHPARPFLDNYYSHAPGQGGYQDMSNQGLENTWTQAVIWACMQYTDFFKGIYTEVQGHTKHHLNDQDGFKNLPEAEKAARWKQDCPVLCKD